MTATDELRRLLDERGVEWFESVTRKGLTWIYRDGKAIRFHPWQPDTLKVSMFDLTPEQAIEATLGSEAEVENTWLKKAYDYWRGMFEAEVAENAELREQIQDAEHEESIAWDRVRSAERRNDKLRELLSEFRDAMWGGGEWTEPFDERMRELGVEVDV